MTTSLPHSPLTSCCRPEASGFFSLRNISIPTRWLNAAALVRCGHICSSSSLPSTHFLGLNREPWGGPAYFHFCPIPPAALLCTRHYALSIVPLRVGGTIIVPTLQMRKLRLRVKQGPIPGHITRKEVFPWVPLHPGDTRYTLHTLPTPEAPPDHFYAQPLGTTPGTPTFPAEQLGAHYLAAVPTLQHQTIAQGTRLAKRCLPIPSPCRS